MTRKLLPAAVLAAAALLTSGQAAAEQRGCIPAIRDLGTLGGDSSDVGDMSRGGLIAGRATDASGEPHAVLWVRGRIVRLDVPGGAEQPSAALSVNDAGVAVGNVGTPGDIAGLRSWVWRGGRANLLPTLPGGGTQARRINDAGEVAGTALAADGQYHPVRWRNGRIEDLGLPPGASDAFGFGINARGDVSGNAFIGTANDERDWAFVWHEGAFRLLSYGQANVVDDTGRAGGRYDNWDLGDRLGIGGPLNEAAWWAPDGTLHDLGVLSPGPSAIGWIFATDRHGDWGGVSADEQGGGAVVSRSSGPLLELPALDGNYGSPSDVHGMNARGDAAGSSMTASGEMHATVWRCAFAQARAL